MGFVFLFLFSYFVYFLEETGTFHILKNYRLIVSFLQKFHLFLFLFAPNLHLFVGFPNQDNFLNSYFKNLYLFIRLFLIFDFNLLKLLKIYFLKIKAFILLFFYQKELLKASISYFQKHFLILKIFEVKPARALQYHLCLL